MKANCLTILLFLAGLSASSADSARFVTITSRSCCNGYVTTNQFSLTDYETAEVASALSQGNCALAYFEKDGSRFDVFNYAVGSLPPVVVKGPATFTLVAQGGECRGLLTLKITPESFSPDKTLILPPSTNQVAITLECSTNLVTWAAATNGVYGSPTDAKFFRIKAEKSN